MLRSNSKSLGNHVVIPEEEKERLRYGKVLQKRKVYAPCMCLVSTPLRAALEGE